MPVRRMSQASGLLCLMLVLRWQMCLFRYLVGVVLELGVEWIAYTKATSTYEMTLKYKRISAHGADLSSRF